MAQNGRPGHPAFSRAARLAAAVTMLAGATLWSAPSADASTFWWRTSVYGMCYGNNSADSYYHTFYYNSGLSSDMRSATDYARLNSLNPTDMTTAMVTLAVDTDVVAYDQDYTDYCGLDWHPSTSENAAGGLAACRYLTANPAGACERWEIRYDESAMNEGGLDYRRYAACQEIGHTVGLDHYNYTYTCMDDDEPTLRTTYSSHEIGVHINPNY